MTNRSLHIISFDNPFPTYYGGVIDVFYKVKALHSIGVSIHLHCFVDEIPSEYNELKSYTSAVFFYKRKLKFLAHLQCKPFSVQSRFSKELINRLNEDDFPILFEGLQTTAILNTLKNKSRKLFLRLHNNEAKYYKGIAVSEQNYFKKWIYFIESLKYKQYQKTVFFAFEKIFSLSEIENKEVNQISNNSLYVPVFHGNEKMKQLSEFGEFALYHGDLRISDNLRAVAFLISIFKELPEYKFIIASKSKGKNIEKQINNSSNISFFHANNHDDLEKLFQKAQLHVLYSFQQSGTKLKVINALFNGRHCLINSKMVDNSSIVELCSVADEREVFKEKIKHLMREPYQHYENRVVILNSHLNDVENAKNISKTIFQN